MLRKHIITIVRSERRTIALQITPDTTLLIKAPRFVSEREIQQFVDQHAEWIERHVALVKKRKTRPVQETGELLYLGKSLQFTPGNYTSISVNDMSLYFPSALLFRKEKELTAWYLSQAKKIITEQTNFFAEQMHAEFKEITFSDTRSQWGRCTHDNRLQFSWRLVMAPMLVINYVIIHELAHTIEKNHSQAFWARVRQFNPSYRQQVKWLTSHGQSLHAEK